MLTYGDKIRNLREKNGDSLKSLAKKLNMSYSSLGKYERSERKITPEFLQQVADIYDVKLSYFYGSEEIEVPDKLKEIGVEWITIIEDLKSRNLSPEDLMELINFADKMKKKP